MAALIEELRGFPPNAKPSMCVTVPTDHSGSVQCDIVSLDWQHSTGPDGCDVVVLQDR